LKETLGDLCGFASTSPHDVLIIPGDWNTHSWTFTDTVSSSTFNYSWLL